VHFAIEDDPRRLGSHKRLSNERIRDIVRTPPQRCRQRELQSDGLLRRWNLCCLPPMNQMDASATRCSRASRRFQISPIQGASANIPLNEMNRIECHSQPLMRRTLSHPQAALGSPDECSEDLLNRIIWHARKVPMPLTNWALTQITKTNSTSGREGLRLEGIGHLSALTSDR